MQTSVGRPKFARYNHWSTLQISEEPLSSGVPFSCDHGPLDHGWCCIYPGDNDGDDGDVEDNDVDDNDSDDDDVEDVRKCESYLACALDADMLRGPSPLQALSLLLAWLLLCSPLDYNVMYTCTGIY